MPAMLRGVGHVVVGMNRQGHWLHLTNVDDSVWRATFSIAPQIAAEGSGPRPTPSRAVQVAWESFRSSV